MRKAAAKTLLILAFGAMLCASLSVFSYAFAEEETYYPDTFRFELELDGITDYALEGDSYIFATSNGVTTVRGENVADYGFNATRVDISEGVFYCSNGSATFYSEDGSTWISREEYGFKDLESFYILDNLYFYNLYDGGISITEIGTGNYDPNTLADFSLMKECGERLYAVYENVLYEIDGYEATPVKISYTDYSAAENVFTGTASLSSWSEALESPDDITLEVGTLVQNAFVSEINLASLSKETFEVVETFEVTETSVPKAGDEVLILCKSGNASIVATGLKAYIVKTADIEPAENAQIASANETGTVNMSGFSTYLVPILNDAAKKDDLYSDEKVTICGKLSSSEMSFLYCDFYLVSYETEDKESYGFVPSPYISADGFADPDYRLTEDDEYSDDSYVLTVVLILIVIALVLLAVGYIVFVATRSKKKKKSDDGEDEENK